MARLLSVALLLVSLALLSGCGINNIPTYEEAAKGAWAQVENQYQRRADLIPNLVETVKGFAAQEREVLIGVIEARSKATQVSVNVDPTDLSSLRQFEEAQGQLGAALGRLIAVSERYPELRSNQNFLALQSQIEGTENRIAVARRDYIAAVQRYNTELKIFPGRLWASTLYASHEPMATFSTAPENAEPPQVDFGREAPQVDFGRGNGPTTAPANDDRQQAPAEAQPY